MNRKGNVAKPLRLGLGACIIQVEYGYIPLFSLHEVKKKMIYDYLLSEAKSWGELKQRACLFDCDEDAERYKTVIVEILEELAAQLLKKLNKAKRPELVIASLGSEAFSRMFDNILAHWDEIYNVRGMWRLL